MEKSQYSTKEKKLFWGCFIALITTSCAFISRMLLLGRFQEDFAIDKVGVGVLQGAGIWPFAISIILFSLIIDKIGYRVAMVFSFVCYAAYLAMASMAYIAIDGVEGAELAAAQSKGYNLLYWGSILLALGNGTVEAFINPVVATIFRKNKTKWLTMLHAGWPGGLVLGGLVTIAMTQQVETGDWRFVLGIIAIPAVVFFVMLLRADFPRSEREEAGVSYREMLAELGAFGAFLGFGLIFAQLGQVFSWPVALVWGLTGAVTVVFGLYTRSFGRPLLSFLLLIMTLVATTEIGTDGWISSLMEKPLEEAGRNAGWVLVYTSFIMLVLRFFAGFIVKRLSPIGILIVSSVLAIVGLFALSKTGAAGLVAIFMAATLYGVGKTFFWPTMIAVVAEQSPKGGALTLNAIAGIGMIAVGILGFPFIGAIQEQTSSAILSSQSGEVAKEVMVEKEYLLGKYQGIDPKKVEEIADPSALEALETAEKAGQFDALAKMAIFPFIMLICYLGIWLYFRFKGGYKPVELTLESER